MNLAEKQLLAKKHPKLYQEIQAWWRANSNEIMRDSKNWKARGSGDSQLNKSNSIDG